MRHEGAEPAPESDRRDHDDYCEHATDQSRAHWDRRSAAAPLEREAQTGHCWGRKPDPYCRVHDARPVLKRLGPLARAPSRPPAVSKRHSQGTEAGDQHGEPCAEHSPVEGDARRRIDLARRPDRRQRRECHADPDSQERPEDNRAQKPERRSPSQCHRVGAERSQNLDVLPVRPQAPADGQAADQQGDESGDGPEHPECDRLGFAGALDLPLGHRGDVEGVDASFREELDDLSLHGGHVSAAVLELEPVGRVSQAHA